MMVKGAKGVKSAKGKREDGALKRTLPKFDMEVYQENGHIHAGGDR